MSKSHVVHKIFCITCLLALAGTPVLGQSPGPVLPFKAGTTFNAYLLRQLHQTYDQRAERLQRALQSEAAMKRYQAEVRKEIASILGPFPEKQPINAKVTGQRQQEGFRVENVVFESRPNHHVTANLYVPKGKGPFPAMLLMNGHEMTAKATESYQKTARLFALNGFVVLSVDPFSQGERVQLTDKTGKSLTRGATTEHTLLNAGANLVGTSVAAYMLWDNIRALDYLETRPEVDKSRIGAVGNSGGGTQTAYLLAFDDRIKVAAPASYFTQRDRYLEVAGPQDGCQFLPGEGDLEMADFMMAAAPKPILILAGENDFVDHYGTLQGYNELQKIYTTLKQPQKVSLFVWPDGHGITQPKREAAVRWFRKWLYQDATPVEEENIGALTEKELQVTNTGQVTTAFENETTIQELNHQRYVQLARQREQLMGQRNLEELRSSVRKVIGLQLNSSPVFTEMSGENRTATYQLQKLVLMREGEFPVPVLVYSPIGDQRPTQISLHLAENGMETLVKTDSLIQQEIRAGNVLVLADVRGVGESLDDPKQNDSKYWSHEYRNAILSLHLKKPLLGQRVQDLVTVIDFLKAQKNWSSLPLHVSADALYGPVVTHATFLDDRIAQARIRNSMESYESFVANPIQKNMYSHVVQGILQFYDLPDLVKKSNGRLFYSRP